MLSPSDYNTEYVGEGEIETESIFFHFFIK